ncbi:pentapeptide repeat-containing protein [Nocardiopsis sp. NPDC055879]
MSTLPGSDEALDLPDFLLRVIPEEWTLAWILGPAFIAFLVISAARNWWLGKDGIGRLIMTAWIIAILAVIAMTALVWIVLGQPGLRLPEELSPRALDAVATRAFAIVAGLAGVALLAISYRRQRSTEDEGLRATETADRETTRLFTERFDSASDKLGSEHAAVRLAGVHALAHLADDAPSWREELVQMVIDVLCAYLRLPHNLPPNPLPEEADQDMREKQREQELEYAAAREVRHTILRIFRSRLRDHTRWRDKDYDFTGVVFDGGDLSKSCFTGGKVTFVGSQFTNGKFTLAGAEFRGLTQLSFTGAEFTGGTVSFAGASFDCYFTFSEALFNGAEVSLDYAIFSRSHGDFAHAEFSKSQVSFMHTDFRNHRVNFTDTTFTGGNVNFAHVHGPIPRGLTEASKRGTPGVITLPPEWLSEKTS